MGDCTRKLIMPVPAKYLANRKDLNNFFWYVTEIPITKPDVNIYVHVEIYKYYTH